MTKKSGLIIAGIVFLALCSIGTIGILVYRFLNTPLALPLAIATTPTAEPAAAATKNVQPTEVQVQFPGDNQAPVCGLSGQMTILMIGRDSKHWEPPYGADAIRMMKFNFDEETMTIFDFNRYLWLITPSLDKSYGLTESMLGPIYEQVLTTDHDKSNADALAARAIAQTLYDNFGVVPEHYVIFEEDMIIRVINTLGGVDLTLPASIKIRETSYAAGKVHLDSQAAELFIRDLPSANDTWSRYERQNLVFQALKTKMSNPANFAKVPQLYSDAKDSIITDLSPEQVIELACVVKNINANKTTLDTIPQDWINVLADNSHHMKDINAVIQRLRQLGF